MENTELKEIKLGVFGTQRGQAFIKAVALIDGAKITGICDKNPKRVEDALKACPPDTVVYETFDELIDSGIDGVILANYFTEHAEFAIKALEKGVAVLSETMAASTIAKCVALCRTVEKTGGLYVFAENYPFARGTWELEKICQKGTLGKVCFAEGEYVHPTSPADSASLAPEEWHWRKFLPATYYSSHALAPLMHITKAMPKRVTAMCALGTDENIEQMNRIRADVAGVMLVYTDQDSVFRVNGSTYLAPHANWYRLSGLNGAAETVRGNEKCVRLVYNDWSRPENMPKVSSYEPLYPTNEKEASKCGHGGGDYWITRQFIECIRDKKEHFFNVYRAVALSAVAIYGWRSALEGGKPYEIPDFSNEEVRRSLENDNLTPFPTADRPNDLPFSTVPVDENHHMVR
mgnify:CR=1 FL=1